MSGKLIFPACIILWLGIANVTSAATDPYPPDGVVQSQTWVILTWAPGATAVSFDVYLGDNFADVDAGNGARDCIHQRPV